MRSTRGKVLLVPGWRGVYGELSDDADPTRPGDPPFVRGEPLQMRRGDRVGRLR